MLPILRNNLSPTFTRFFEDEWEPTNWDNHLKGTSPAVNIKEGANEYTVEVAAPGMQKDDFEVELNNDVLNIKSEKKDEKQEKVGDTYTRREFNYHSFNRSFNLNNQVVDGAKIKANYADGILSVTLPKKEEAKEKPARIIKIN